MHVSEAIISALMKMCGVVQRTFSLVRTAMCESPTLAYRTKALLGFRQPVHTASMVCNCRSLIARRLCCEDGAVPAQKIIASSSEGRQDTSAQFYCAFINECPSAVEQRLPLEQLRPPKRRPAALRTATRPLLKGQPHRLTPLTTVFMILLLSSFSQSRFVVSAFLVIPQYARTK